MEKLINYLKIWYKNAVENNDDMNAKSWGYEEGILITANEAKLIIDEWEVKLSDESSGLHKHIVSGLLPDEDWINNKMASKFTLIAGEEQFELCLGQSPRGLRNKEKRPDKVIIESNECFDLVQLRKYIDYLQTLSCALEDPGEI